MPCIARRPVPGWLWGCVALLAFSLLGQGEQAFVDARFASPSATLDTYWEALRANDEVVLSECMLDPSEELPFPGMLWFLPPTGHIDLDGFRTLSISGGRLVITYRVRFRPYGTARDLHFETSNELVREHGEWHISRGIGSASVPEWRSIPRTIDL